MPISFEYKEALQHLVTGYWTIAQSEKEELPDWFHIVADFMEVECQLRFNITTGTWEVA